MTLLTTAQQVRLKISDPPVIDDRTLIGDGLATTFTLPYRNVSSGTAFVPNGASWTATAGATFDPTGSVTLSNVVSANSALRVRYVYSTFSDDEIGTWLTAEGDVLGASIEAVQSLMFDSMRRAVWRAPDGSTYDDRIAQSLLAGIYSALKNEQAQEAIGQGGVSEWGLNQANW